MVIADRFTRVALRLGVLTVVLTVLVSYQFQRHCDDTPFKWYTFASFFSLLAVSILGIAAGTLGAIRRERGPPLVLAVGLNLLPWLLYAGLSLFLRFLALPFTLDPQ